ncbi:hypothetical protein [Streptomyces sp. NPDC002855]|uniref:hypothetical protein n=1 Tax=Streptomyces sp. NPDC002855 TaxID=3154437 RepID=UPI0033263C70
MEGRTAVLHRSKNDPEALCNQVAFVDIDTGERFWGKASPTSETVFGTIAGSGARPSGSKAVAMS